jgi:hypothetical protein
LKLQISLDLDVTGNHRLLLPRFQGIETSTRRCHELAAYSCPVFRGLFRLGNVALYVDAAYSCPVFRGLKLPGIWDADSPITLEFRLLLPRFQGIETVAEEALGPRRASESNPPTPAPFSGD